MASGSRLPPRPLPAGEDERPLVTERDLVECFSNLGVTRGGAVLVHSSLSSLGVVRGGAHAVVDALLEVIGPDGLLIMPTHTWSTVGSDQPVFHETLSPSTTGLITEELRRRPSAVRSLHPTHSVAALGRGAVEFCRGHELRSTPCSHSSPYGRLVAAAGQVLLIGVGLESFTLMHAFEEWAEVPWLFNRSEDLAVLTADGSTLTVASQRHTNDPHYEERDFPSLEPVLRDGGAIGYGRVGSAEVRLVDAATASDLLLPLIRANPDIVLGAPSARESPRCQPADVVTDRSTSPGDLRPL